MSTVNDRIDTARSILSSMRVTQPRVPRPPGPSGLRASWQMMTGRRAPYEVFSELAGMHEPVVHLSMGGEHIYVLFSPEAVWDVFVTHGRHTRKSLALQLTRPLLGDGLLTADGPEHMRHRRAIQPLFHHRRIAGYVSDMNAAVATTSAHLHDGRRVELQELMAELTLDVIGRTIFGVDLRGEAVGVGTALGTVLDGFGRGLGPLASPLSRIPTPRRQRERSAIIDLDAVVTQMMTAREESAADGPAGADLLTLLMSARDESGAAAFTADEVRDETMTLVLAGHETTALTLTWALHLLSHHHGMRAWLEEELDATPPGPLAFEDLAGLVRTHAVVAESIRLHPPAWIIGRWLDANLRVGGWDLPRGSAVLAPQYAFHRDPRYWPHAGEFRPQRWLTDDGRFDERAPRVPRGVWFPFGFGTRRCIGEQFAWTEAVLVLASLARSWHFDVDAPSRVPMQSAITLRPAVPLPTDVRARR